jgi:hypothetical protein
LPLRPLVPNHQYAAALSPHPTHKVERPDIDVLIRHNHGISIGD